MSAIFKQNHAQQCEAWSQLSAENRAAILRDASGKLAELTSDSVKADKLVNHLLMQSHRLDEVTRLTGATGESNDFYASARGKTMIVGTENAETIPVLGQLVAALLAGNEVILHYPTAPSFCQQALDILQQCGMLPEVMSVANDSQLNVLLHMNRLALVAAVGTFDEMMSISQTLAETGGILTQLVSVIDTQACSEMFEPEYLERFTTERVKTVNTTAIGGNASLIELGMG